MNPIGYLALVATLVFTNFFANVDSSPNTKLNIARQTDMKLTYTPQPISIASNKFPADASSALSYDINSGLLLAEKNIDQRRPIASINKLMTALVIMQSHKPNEIVKVGKLPELGPYDQKIGISEGEEFELSELLRATLIQSANDAANALAVYDSGSIEKFAQKMNTQSEGWGLKNSKFTNASGLEGGDDYSSARDVLTMGMVLYHSPVFRDIISTGSQSIYNQAGKKYLINTTNKILGQKGVVGMKTGYTLKAGECLIAVASRNGHSIATVVLDSPDRFQESKNMIDWSFNNYIWQ